MGGGEAGSCFSMPDSIALQVLLCLLFVLLALLLVMLLSVWLLSMLLLMVVDHLMKCKQTRCDVIPFDMTGNNNDTGVSHNLQFFIINFNIVLHPCHHHH